MQAVAAAYATSLVESHRDSRVNPLSTVKSDLNAGCYSEIALALFSLAAAEYYFFRNNTKRGLESVRSLARDQVKWAPVNRPITWPTLNRRSR